MKLRPGAAWLLVFLLSAVAALAVWRGATFQPDAPWPDQPLLDINRAGEMELRQLPGVGRRLARAVADHRRTHGPFRSWPELLRVKGMGPGRLARLRAFIQDLGPARTDPEKTVPASQP